MVAADLMRQRVATNPLWLPVHGMSMQPSIVDGTEVKLVPGSRPRRGEVWAFCRAEGDVVVHRCRRRETGGYVFAGDAQLIADAPVHDDQLIGKVVAIRGEGASRAVTGRDRWIWKAKNAHRALRSRLEART
jgi:phage repressor protein C with HTH and peptisase S24 domain